MHELSKIGEGGSVGEYALLHRKKRSATVRTYTHTHFAIMDREAFQEVMFNIKMKESDHIVDFFDQYEFMRELTYNTKAKLGYRIVNKKYVLGQEVFNEGNKADTIYFIESGQFVITKDLYISSNSSTNLNK